MTLQVIERINAVLLERGAQQYGGEAVNALEHALQCAQVAESEAAPPALIAAALLHDIGHLVHHLGEAPAERGLDDRHERIGANFLAAWFPPQVVEPVRLHVAAKRYLCTVDADYFAGLSAASVRSLGLQGGQFSTQEAQAFLAQPHAPQAVGLRRWDEAAKVHGAATPPLSHYLGIVEQVLAG